MMVPDYEKIGVVSSFAEFDDHQRFDVSSHMRESRRKEGSCAKLWKWVRALELWRRGLEMMANRRYSHSRTPFSQFGFRLRTCMVSTTLWDLILIESRWTNPPCRGRRQKKRLNLLSLQLGKKTYGTCKVCIWLQKMNWCRWNWKTIAKIQTLLSFIRIEDNALHSHWV